MTDQEFRDALEAAQEMCDDPAAYPRSIISEALLHAASLLEQERKARAQAEANYDKQIGYINVLTQASIGDNKEIKELEAERSQLKAELEKVRKAWGEEAKNLIDQRLRNVPIQAENEKLQSQVAEYERALEYISSFYVTEGTIRCGAIDVAKQALASRGSKVEELVDDRTQMAKTWIKIIDEALVEMEKESLDHISISKSLLLEAKEQITRQALKAFRGDGE